MGRTVFTTIALALALVFSLHSILVLADVVSYIDTDGRTHYVDSLERVPPQYRHQAQSRPTPRPINKFDFQLERYAPKKKTPEPATGDSKKNAAHDYSTTPPSNLSRHPKVDIYVTSWCPYCRALESFLSERGVRYTKHDIEASSGARTAHAKLGGGGIPVAKIGSQVVRGFDKARLLDALSAAR